MVDHADHRAKVGLSLVGGVRLDPRWHQIGHIPWVTINSCDRRGSRHLWLLAQAKANQAELKLGSYAVANPAGKPGTEERQSRNSAGKCNRDTGVHSVCHNDQLWRGSESKVPRLVLGTTGLRFFFSQGLLFTEQGIPHQFARQNGQCSGRLLREYLEWGAAVNGNACEDIMNS